jgi:hypothetical protein
VIRAHCIFLAIFKTDSKGCFLILKARLFALIAPIESNSISTN